jgi:hypothetical protein
MMCSAKCISVQVRQVVYLLFRSVVSQGCCRMDVRGPVPDNYMDYDDQQRRRLPFSQPPKSNPVRGNCHSAGMGHTTHCDEERAWKWCDLYFAAHD